MLKVSRLADYAVLIMSSLGMDSHAHRPASVIAADTGLPEPTASKVLKSLAREGMLDSLRGTAGGYRLARPAVDITIADIVAAIDGPVALTPCVEGSGDNCQLSGQCGLSGRWTPVNRAVQAALESVTLADMMRPAFAAQRMDSSTVERRP
jgi:FeS assembly SUF system regulator